MDLTDYNSKNKSIKQIQLYFMFLHEEEKTMKRQKMTRLKSQRSFKKGMKTQIKNFAPPVTRGGYRF